MAEGDINLATLWVPVLPETSKIGEAMRKAGEEGRKNFQEGFSAGGFDQVFSQITTKGIAMASGIGTALGNLASGAVQEFGHVIEEVFSNAIELGEKLAEKILDVGEQFEAANRTLTLYTTQGSALMGDFANVMGTLDTTTKNTAMDLAELNTRLGLTGKALDDAAHWVAELRDRFGALNVQQLTGWMKDLNVSGDQTVQMLADMDRTAGETGTSIQTLNADMAGADFTLRALNLSMSQNIHFMGVLESQGINGAQATNILGRAMKEAVKEGVPFEQFIKDQAIQMQAYIDAGDKLAAQGDVMGAAREYANADAIANMFGAKNAVEAKNVLQDLLDTIKGGRTQWDGSTDAMKRQVEMTKNLENAWDALQNKITVTLGPIAIAIMDKLGGALDWVSNWFTQHHDEIVTKIRDWGDKFIEAIPKIQHFAGEMVRMMGPVVDFLVKGLGYVVEALGAITGSDALYNLGHQMTNFDATPLANKIADAIEKPNIDTSKIKSWWDDAWNKALPPGSGPHVGVHPDPQKPGGGPLTDPHDLFPGSKDGIHIKVTPDIDTSHIPGWLKFLLGGISDAYAPDTPENRKKYGPGGSEGIPPWITPPGPTPPAPPTPLGPAPPPGTPWAPGNQPNIVPGPGKQGIPIPAHTSGYTNPSGNVTPGQSSGTDWNGVATYEASGNWSTNTGNGFYGGLQIQQSTWEEFGGLAYAQRADLATKEQQIAIAEKILAGQGPNAWPTTARNHPELFGGRKSTPDTSGGGGGGGAPYQRDMNNYGPNNPWKPGMSPNSGPSGGSGGGAQTVDFDAPQSGGGGYKDAVDAFAASQSGKPYKWGGSGDAGHGGLFDCSGFMSAIYNHETGMNMPEGTRFFTTTSDFTRLGFIPESSPHPGHFEIGVNEEHMAGTLPSGVNVESGGAADKTQYGGQAAGAWSAQFSQHFYLPTGSDPQHATMADWTDHGYDHHGGRGGEGRGRTTQPWTQDNENDLLEKKQKMDEANKARDDAKRALDDPAVVTETERNRLQGIYNKALEKATNATNTYNDALDRKNKKTGEDGQGEGQESGHKGPQAPDVLGGLFDMLGLGNVFGGKNPEDWEVVKLAKNIAQFGFGLLEKYSHRMNQGYAGQGGAPGGDGGGGPQSPDAVPTAGGPQIPQVPHIPIGNPPHQPGAGLGSGPPQPVHTVGSITNDNSINIHNTGADTKQQVKLMQEQQNQRFHTSTGNLPAMVTV